MAPLTYVLWLLAYFEDDLLGAAARFLIVKLIAVSGSTIVQVWRPCLWPML